MTYEVIHNSSSIGIYICKRRAHPAGRLTTSATSLTDSSAFIHWYGDGKAHVIAIYMAPTVIMHLPACLPIVYK